MLKIVFAVIAAIFLFLSPAAAQTEKVQPKYKTVYIPKITIVKNGSKTKSTDVKSEQVIDSLNKIIEEYKLTYEKLLEQDRLKDSVFSDANGNYLKQQAHINYLENKIANYKSVDAESDRNNRMLIILNSIVALMLLVFLIWLLIRKPRKVKVLPVKPLKDKSIPLPISNNNNISVEQNLQHLERLGKLREKGILNEEEFNLQKQLIMGKT